MTLEDMLHPIAVAVAIPQDFVGSAEAPRQVGLGV